MGFNGAPYAADCCFGVSAISPKLPYLVRESDVSGSTGWANHPHPHSSTIPQRESEFGGSDHGSLGNRGPYFISPPIRILPMF
ncbi:hypothetical protein U1Q18_023715 [Sarracenia purpurea var. burkii]